ncbi:MAG: four helix bundle protein, partial [bacterium]|nr:four helix bundle protein [bacterium]
MNTERIQSFTDLHAWQEGHRLVLMVYRATQSFPKEELFGLTIQLRRAIVSVTSNIAEGFSRRSYREKTQLFSIALGSLTETQSQLLIARDLGYLSREEFQRIAEQAIGTHKLLNAFIRSTRSRIPDSRF